MERIVLLYDQEIHLDLPMAGYRLIPGYVGQLGLPVEIYLRLYAVKDEEKTLIATPQDLSRFVTHIDNEDAAWRFLRLFTAPQTHYLFQRDVYTIDLEVSMSRSSPGTGVISPAVAQRIGYLAPEMRREARDYVARRDLVRADARTPSLPAAVLRRREAVSEAGAYRFIEELVVAQLERQHVIIPSYE